VPVQGADPGPDPPAAHSSTPGAGQ
jgi:hypothetical protein